MLGVRRPVSKDIVFTINAHIMNIGMQLLLSLDVLHQLKLILNFDDGALHSTRDDWRMTMIIKTGYLYAERPPAISYAESELRKIHHHLIYTSTDELSQLIHEWAEKYIAPELLEQVHRIRTNCKTCQRKAHKPYRFRVAIHFRKMRVQSHSRN